MALDTGWRKISARLVTSEETVGVYCQDCLKISIKLRDDFLKNISPPKCDHCDSSLVLSEEEEKRLKKFQQ